MIAFCIFQDLNLIIHEKETLVQSLVHHNNNKQDVNIFSKKRVSNSKVFRYNGKRMKKKAKECIPIFTVFFLVKLQD